MYGTYNHKISPLIFEQSNHFAHSIYRWAPVDEHSKFITYTYIGGNVGTILAYPIYGLILDRLGWEVVIFIGDLI